MEDLPLDRIAALIPEFAVKDLPLGRTLMMMIAISATQGLIFPVLGWALFVVVLVCYLTTAMYYSYGQTPSLSLDG